MPTFEPPLHFTVRKGAAAIAEQQLIPHPRRAQGCSRAPSQGQLPLLPWGPRPVTSNVSVITKAFCYAHSLTTCARGTEKP